MLRQRANRAARGLRAPHRPAARGGSLASSSAIAAIRSCIASPVLDRARVRRAAPAARRRRSPPGRRPRATGRSRRASTTRAPRRSAGSTLPSPTGRTASGARRRRGRRRRRVHDQVDVAQLAGELHGEGVDEERHVVDDDLDHASGRPPTSPSRPASGWSTRTWRCRRRRRPAGSGRRRRRTRRRRRARPGPRGRRGGSRSGTSSSTSSRGGPPLPRPWRASSIACSRSSILSDSVVTVDMVPTVGVGSIAGHLASGWRPRARRGAGSATRWP